MFKLESYITPILLSYVDKYIKNFRPEDSQVSLWGGDASFHNLDLRLDVLEQELQLPFSLISGHIHELLIHVPWTKLASEPIKITINTIECSLTLRGSENANAEQANISREKRKQNRKQDITAAPPGYVQNVINKIVNNITINCNNLILKYVEEDIVVSVNIKLLTFQSANEFWKAAFTDVAPMQALMRKLITLSDLTVCLDKRNAAGKIEIYQEPILYRCFVEMRFLRQFLSNNSKATSTKLDIYCNRMEFSMTEQQIPMLIRIMNLLLALHQRQLKNEAVSDISSPSTMEDEDGNAIDDTWTGWAWSFAATIFPSDDSNVEYYSQNKSYSGNTFQLGVYIDNAIFTFKVSEFYSNDKGYYSTRKLKYWPLLCLQFNGCYVDTVVGGLEWTSVRMGISEALLIPQGICSCGISDISDNIDAQHYFKIGSLTDNYKSESLFDPKEESGDSSRRSFMISWEHYLATVTESVLLDKTPAFAVDYLYHLELPDDYTSEKLSELGSDLEFSNLVEQSICRIVAGPFTMHICSGLIHRVSTLYEVMKSYDYAPYTEQLPEPELNELHPPSEDDFDALSNCIPSRVYQVTLLKPVFVFQLMDHPKFSPSKDCLFRRIKKTSGIFSVPNVSLKCPSITIECETFDTKIIFPMYPKRLVHTTCQLPDPPSDMLTASYRNCDVKIVGLSSQMVFNANKKITLLVPSNISCIYKSILFPKYWINTETIHHELIIDIESFTISCTKAKLMVIHHIIEKILLLDIGDSKSSIFASTLLQDAAKDAGMVVLELYVEQLKWKNIQTICTESYNLNINSIKAFVLEPPFVNTNINEVKRASMIQEPNQVLIISGPDYSEIASSPKKNQDNVLLNAVLQFPRNSEQCIHPTLLTFNLKEIKACIDPLLFQWLFYSPKYFNVKYDLKSSTDTIIYKPKMLADVTSSVQDTPRRTGSRHGSIHGSSERDNLIHVSPKPQTSVEDTKEQVQVENTYTDFILKWYKVCSNMVIFGDLAECTVYFPTKSLSAVGSQGIEDAINYFLGSEAQLKIMVINLPHFIVHTTGQRQSIKISKLPIKLPANLWTVDKFSFPWGIEIKNICAYTLENKKKLYFLKPVSGNITIGLSLKYKTENISPTMENKVELHEKKLLKSNKNSKNEETSTDNISHNIENISSFSLCVYIDNTPVIVALSHSQVHLISSILKAVLEVVSKFNPKSNINVNNKLKEECVNNLFRKSQSQSSPTFIKEDTMLESLSEKTPTSTHADHKQVEENIIGIKCTIWMQWTITRFRIKVYSHNFNELKLVFDMEDIMSSLDVQDIYTKFKAKIVTANIHHYKRKSKLDKWEPGIYFGTIMRNREELPSSDKQDDFGFMTITATKAKSGHVHSKWGANKKYKLAEMKVNENVEEPYFETRYISEIITTFQPMDFIISPRTLQNFYVILKPLLHINGNSRSEDKSWDHIACINNSKLPLAYLDCKGLRIVILCSELIEKFENNICIIEIESINLLPTAENPICRNPIRPDIYQQAAQNRILNIPGSDIEDRQYQLNINNFSVNTGSWKEFSQMLCRETVTSLHTMNENPALEWNNLEWGRLSLIPNLNLLPIIKKCNQNIIIAPAITWGGNILICGCAMEFNLISDIEINISLEQYHLISVLTAEFIYFMKTANGDPIEPHTIFTYLNNSDINMENSIDDEQFEQSKDSGVEIIDNNSEIISRKTCSASTNLEEKRNLFRFNSESRSSEFSQCIKCTSFIPSAPHKLNYCPSEFLFTGGQITISLYKITYKKVIDIKDLRSGHSLDDTEYDASEEDSVCDKKTKKKHLPLMFILISQPNIYMQDVAFAQKTNFSCFDIYIKTTDVQYSYIDKLPSAKDYQMHLLETKTGICDPVTGIPPSFITIKFSKHIRKSPAVDIEFGRPIQVNYSFDILNHLLYIKNHVMETFNAAKRKLITTEPIQLQHKIVDSRKCLTYTDDTFIKYKSLKLILNDVSNLNLKIAQIVLFLKTRNDRKMVISLDKIESFLTFLTRPERIVNTTLFKNIIINTFYDGSSYLLLHPWSLTLKTFVFWESWQKYDSDPQLQITVDSDCLNIDLGPEQMKCMESVIEEGKEIGSNYFTNDPYSNHMENASVPLHNDRDQYYKDDLRAGAFQFVDATGNENELPLPYQVLFWNETVVAMAWRYPQPRILTKVRVVPVPFKLNNDLENQQVLCFLEYWCDCLGSYKSYTQFYLSETEVCQLDLPRNVPQSSIASIWRVVLSFSNSKLNSSHYISPRVLAACMRIDSYFNPILIPRLQLALNLYSFKFCLYNQFNKRLALKMPEKLKNYTPDGFIPDKQCFLIFHMKNTSMYIASWYSNLSTIDFQTTAGCLVLDYSSLSMQSLIQPVLMKLVLHLGEFVNVNFISEPIIIKFSPAIGHTFAISSQLWSQNWMSNYNSEPADMIVVTRYVICNDTPVKLRFGQYETDEDILLSSRFLHLYCWRSQKSPRKIRVGIEQNGWKWSEPLNIDTIKSQVIEIVSNNIRSTLIVNVKNLSATQKQIIFSGQLVVCNMLLDHFEMKVIPFISENKNLDIKNSESYVVNGRSTAPSLLINMEEKLSLRLRFLTLESAWSGDVPLEENTKCTQPWLVKIPLQERGQFLSIWCRIINQKSGSSRKLLVLLWPLFMIRSNLPVVTKVLVETPVLNVKLQTTVKGKGELQQLYCPGTIDHSHHLTFEMGTSTLNSNPYVPLNYSLIEHTEIFQKFDTDSVDDILEFLNKYDNSSWPYSNNKLIHHEWVTEQQPLTHIQVQYQTTCKYSSSLLVEVVPWCLLLNMIGTPISIILEGKEVCNVCHYGVITPPKLENTFNLAIRLHDILYISPSLQLARADWSQSFYMPKINGVIPLNGNIKVPIRFNSMMCLLSVASKNLNELRVLEVSSSFVITNYTNLKLQIICIALKDNNCLCSLKNNVMRHHLLLQPTLKDNNLGVPLNNWYCPEDIGDSNYTLHIIVATETLTSSSCPIRVDKDLFRKNICLYSATENIPLLLIAQEYKGIIYLSLHHDIHPQLLIKNNCTETFYYAQSDTTCQPVMENNCISWTNSIKPRTKAYYTMPSVAEKFPNVDSSSFDKLLIAVEPSNSISFQWSHDININIFNEQYVKVPMYGDIKVSVKKFNSTILITIDSVTEVEFSAQDIRSRLSLQATEFSEKKSLGNNVEISCASNISVLKNKDSFYRKETTDRISNYSEEINKNSMKNVLQNYNVSHSDKWKFLDVVTILKSLTFILSMDDDNEGYEQREIMTLTCDSVAITLNKNQGMNCCVSIADIQCDNKLFHKGCFDFPVVFLGNKQSKCNSYFNTTCINDILHEIRTDCDVMLNFRIERWKDKHTDRNITEIQEVNIQFGPMSLYIEDVFVTKLVDYLNDLLPNNLVMWSINKNLKISDISNLVEIPEHLPWEAGILAKPLFLDNLIICQISLLLSVHSSVKLYIALDRSPMQFSRFERKHLRTTAYQLGHSLTMHYLSGAIFGAGWVVGSLELLGSPSGLARSLGSGLRDFISLPYHGFIQGPWAFLIGITHGSASLMRHITAGTVDSVTKLAASVARNLDRLTLDEEHQKRTEESRRQKPQGLAEGFVQGLTGLGISLLGAVGGVAHHPLQSVIREGASPRNLVAGVGLGLVGIITKPLSGAAELVALTGQGLLQGAGWNPLPVPRLYFTNSSHCLLENHLLKFKWKLLQNITLDTNIITTVDAVFKSKSVIILITLEYIIIINVEEEIIEKMINFNEISSIEKSFSDFTEIQVSLIQQIANPTSNTESYEHEMDQVSRARVADYVRTTANLIKLSPSLCEKKPCSTSLIKFNPTNPLFVFFVSPQIRNYLYDILIFLKLQTENNIFKIL